MSDSQGQGFPENPPDPPNIPPDIQFKEEATLAGMLIGSVLYGMYKTPPPTRLSALTPFVGFIPGILIVLFFQCMAALLNPIHRRGWRIKWGLVFYTAVMFSVATVFTAMNLGVQFLSFFNYHGFAGGGPLGYHMFIGPTVLRITPSLTFLLNNWLANGLLVTSPFAAAFTRLTLAPPLALSLLRYLLNKPRGRCPPLPHLPRFSGYVLQFSTNWR